MTKLRIIRNRTRFWSLHTHSKFSNGDALPSVKDVVARAKELGYRGLGLTDHGNMAGTVQLYTECMKAGIKPFPGTEFYVVRDRGDKKAKRYHSCVVAYTTQGYRNLIALNTLSHRNFHNKPLLDMADLAQAHEEGLTEGLAITTGCYFGLVIQTLVHDGYEAAKRVVAGYASWFPGSTYIEVQSHCIEQEGMSEQEISDALVQIADELALPLIVTQDSHYTHPEHKAEHESLKRLVSYSADVDEAVFPGDGFHMVGDDWMERHHSGEVMERAYAGLDDLLDRHTLRVPELDHYDYRVPFTSDDPMADMKQRCAQELVRRGLAKSKYFDRLDSEIEIVEVSRMAGYLMLVAEVTDYCTANSIFFQARGSASGSLIAWLLGITSVDPLKWGLLMERFLSKDRTKPPDVDLDIEHTRRAELITYLSERYAVNQIGTWGTFSLAGEDDGKGSLKVRYLSSLRKQGKVPDWAAIPAQDKAQLFALSDMACYSGYGVHAAGLLMTSTRSELESMVPLMYVASSKTFVSQYDMKDVEQLGLVKLDVLGLKTLSVLHATMDNLGRDVRDGLDWIPTNDSKTFTQIGRGDTAGVFQLEGGTAARGMRSLRPNHVRDVVAAMALYRPATMKSGATDAYVARKHKEEETPPRHEIIERHTKDTHGILLYQEQVIAVLRDLGLDPDDLTRFLKAVKASNGDIGNASGVIAEMLGGIKDRCLIAGMTLADVAWLEEALAAYAGYGFNKAHSVVYGLTAYRCAYLATNHPLEFHAALLEIAAGTDKETLYIRATRGRKIRILKPDVNLSNHSYGVDPRGRGIRKGLLGIKGVGLVAARNISENKPYASINDFLSRVNSRAVTGSKPLQRRDFDVEELLEEETTGVVAKLYDAGAFTSIMKEHH